MGQSLKNTRYWSGLLAEYAESGLTVAQFCEMKGIGVQIFHRWRQKLAVDSRLAGLELKPLRLALEPEAAAGAAAESGVSIETGGAVVRLRSGFDCETRARALEVLGGRPC